jgi:hypothetical protein
MSFFIATRFHGLRVIIGTTFLLTCLLRQLNKHFSSNLFRSLEVYADLSSELLGFWTLPVARNSKYKKTQRLGNWICFRPVMKREDAYCVGQIM